MKPQQVPGIEYTTFSIAARCKQTGQVGVGISTRSIAVTSRCVWVSPHVGVVVTQSITDPRLGHLGRQLLQLGYSASRVLTELEASDPHIEYRQLAVVDQDGNAVARTGAENRDWAGHVTGEGYAAMGNYLVSERTVQAMAGSFESTADLSLDERLLRAIEAGRDAGGQHEGQNSAGLVVYDRAVYPYVDLRVDWHDEPIGELRRVFDVYQPQAEYLYLRPADPTLPDPTRG